MCWRERTPTQVDSQIWTERVSVRLSQTVRWSAAPRKSTDARSTLELPRSPGPPPAPLTYRQSGARRKPSCAANGLVNILLQKHFRSMLRFEATSRQGPNLYGSDPLRSCPNETWPSQTVRLRRSSPKPVERPRERTSRTLARVQRSRECQSWCRCGIQRTLVRSRPRCVPLHPRSCREDFLGQVLRAVGHLDDHAPRYEARSQTVEFDDPHRIE
jgi:hypothetical protein